MSDSGDLRSDIRLFMKSRAILTAAELDLFTELDQNRADAPEIAARLRLHERAATRLLDCLVAFGLLVKSSSGYRPSEQAATLSAAHPETILPSVLHLNHLWENWSHLTESVRLGENPHREPKAKRQGKRLEAFIGTMHVAGRELSRRLAGTYDLSRFGKLLDIGAGAATYTIAFLQKNHRMSAILFDLPEVVPLAEERLRAAGLEERVELVAGDFYEDELPGGCDLALLSAIIHQNSPTKNLELFRKVRRSLAPGGALLIRDHIMNEERTAPADGALFALNMLVCTDGGDSYTFGEVRETLLEAGFKGVELVRCGEGMDSLVEAIA